MPRDKPRPSPYLAYHAAVLCAETKVLAATALTQSAQPGTQDTSVGEKWFETHVRSHIAFACARVLQAEMRFIVRAHIASANP